MKILESNPYVQQEPIHRPLADRDRPVSTSIQYPHFFSSPLFCRYMNVGELSVDLEMQMEKGAYRAVSDQDVSSLPLAPWFQEATVSQYFSRSLFPTRGKDMILPDPNSPPGTEVVCFRERSGTFVYRARSNAHFCSVEVTPDAGCISRPNIYAYLMRGTNLHDVHIPWILFSKFHGRHGSKWNHRGSLLVENIDSNPNHSHVPQFNDSVLRYIFSDLGVEVPSDFPQNNSDGDEYSTIGTRRWK